MLRAIHRITPITIKFTSSYLKFSVSFSSYIKRLCHFIVMKRKKYFHRSIKYLFVILSPIHVSTGDLHRWRKCYCLRRSPRQTFATGKTAKGRLKGPERVADICTTESPVARDRHAPSLSISLHRLISGSSSLFHCLPFNTRVSTRRM